MNYNQEAFQLQLGLFMREVVLCCTAACQRLSVSAQVRQQFLVPTIRSYLKLYTSMAVDKLADCLEMEESEFR